MMVPTGAQLAATAPQQPARSQELMQAEGEASCENCDAGQQEDDEDEDRVSYQVGCTSVGPCSCCRCTQTALALLKLLSNCTALAS